MGLRWSEAVFKSGPRQPLGVAIVCRKQTPLAGLGGRAGSGLRLAGHGGR
jgi:hypothetical protein